MSPTMYTTAIRYNNEAALHIQSGEYVEARKSCNKALDCLKAAIAVSQGCSAIEEDDNTSNVVFRWSMNPRTRSLHEDCATADIAEESSDASAFVYRHALLMYPNAFAVMDNATNGYMEESATIIYNMALACHLYALENHSVVLHNALGFYKIAMDIRKMFINVKSDESNFFDMAVLNNMGQIHHDLANYSAAQSCFARLSRQLLRLHQSGMDSVMDARDCAGFIMNLMLEPPSLAAAA